MARRGKRVCREYGVCRGPFGSGTSRPTGGRTGVRETRDVVAFVRGPPVWIRPGPPGATRACPAGADSAQNDDISASTLPSEPYARKTGRLARCPLLCSYGMFPGATA